MTTRFVHWPRRSSTRIGTAFLALLALAGLIAVASGGAATTPLGADLRISFIGPEGDAARSTNGHAITYNPAANEYLAVWEGDDLADNDTEIFGQRLGAGGDRLGPRFQISDAGDAERDSQQPAITYNLAANQYLVVWYGDDLATNEEYEIFGQRLDASGAEIGADDFRISDVGTDGDTTHGAFDPAVAHDPLTNQYVVVWEADDLATDNEFEIYGQRLNASGTQVGSNDFRLSSVGTDGDGARDAGDAEITFNAATGEYLVTWDGDEITNNELEIYGQRLNASGVQIGANDFRISAIGTDGDATRTASTPAIAAGPSGDYLVVWYADGLVNNDEFEIFGQRLAGDGSSLGADFRISTIGADGDATRDAFNPAVAYDTTTGEYLATFDGDGLAADNDFEVFGQRLNAGGAELGTDFRISTTGPEGDPDPAAFRPKIAYNPSVDQYLVTWIAAGFATPDEREVFGHRLGEPPPPPPPPTTSPTAKCLGKTATRVGTAGNDTINGTRGRDVIVSFGGRDVIRSFAGNDLICAGAGNDVIKTGTGTDSATGGPGADRIIGAAGNQRLFGNAGNDSIFGNSGNDRLFGQTGNDRLFGLAGFDRLYGNRGRDLLNGGRQRDICRGPTRSDRRVKCER